MKTGSGKDKLPKESIVLDLGQDELPVHPSIGALPGVEREGMDRHGPPNYHGTSMTIPRYEITILILLLILSSGAPILSSGASQFGSLCL